MSKDSRANSILFTVLMTMSILFIGVIAWVLCAWNGLGAFPTADVQNKNFGNSGHWDKDHFVSPEPAAINPLYSVIELFGLDFLKEKQRAVPVDFPERGFYVDKSKSGLRTTWLGHSSVLLEIDGVNILIDPFFSDYYSPIPFFGSSRWQSSPIDFDDLPYINAVAISHDHYKHLDFPSIQKMSVWKCKFIVPLGVGEHLKSWGIPDKRIIELNWDGSTNIDGLTVVATPARHSSGRVGPILTDQTLFSGFAFLGKKHRVWYSGSTGFFKGFSKIGGEYGPFDLAIIDVVTGENVSPTAHMNAQEAVQANLMAGGVIMMGMNAWTNEPTELVDAAENESVDLVLPKVGQPFEISEYQNVNDIWW